MTTPPCVETRSGQRRGSLRVASRLGWRNLRRRPWITLLIGLLIGLPVFLGTAVSVITVSSTPNTEETWNQTLYGFDGVILDRRDEKFDRNTEIPGFADLFMTLAVVDDEKLSDYPAGDVVPKSQVTKWKEQATTVVDKNDPVPDGVTAHRVFQGTATLKLDGNRQVFVDAVVADFTDERLYQDNSLFILEDGGKPPTAGKKNGSKPTIATSPELQKYLASLSQYAQDQGESALNTSNFTVELDDGTTFDAAAGSHMRDGAVDQGSMWQPWDFNSYQRSIFVDENSALGHALLKHRGLGTTTWYLEGELPSAYEEYLPYWDAGYQVVFRPVIEKQQALEDSKAGPTENDISNYIDENYESYGTLFPMRNGLYFGQVSPSVMFYSVGSLAFTAVLVATAFSIRARQQRRASALLAVNGAEPLTIQQTMAMSGLWVGTVSGLTAAVLGVCTGIGFILWARSTGMTTYSIKVPWLATGLLVLLAIGVSLLASWLPATRVAHQDAWSAVRGAARQVGPHSKKVFFIGVGLATLGVVALIVTVVVGTIMLEQRESLDVMGGLALALIVTFILLVVGVSMMLPGMLAWLARIAKSFSYSWRAALRDANRHRAQNASVIVAIMATVVIGCFATGYAAIWVAPIGPERAAPRNDLLTAWIISDKERQELADAAETTASGFSAEDAAAQSEDAVLQQVATSVRRLAGANIVDSYKLGTLEQYCDGDVANCVGFHPIYSESSECRLPYPTEGSIVQRSGAIFDKVWSRPRSISNKCRGFDYYGDTSYTGSAGSSELVVASPEDPPAFLWGADPQTTEAFRQGKAVVFHPEYLETSTEGKVLNLGRFSWDPRQQPGLKELGIDKIYDSKDPTENEDWVESIQQEGYPPVEAGNFLWEPEEEFKIPAVGGMTPANFSYVAVVPDTVLAKTGAEPTSEELVMLLDRNISQSEFSPVADELGAKGLGVFAMSQDESFKRWMITVWSAMVILILTVAGITVALSVASARRDYDVLHLLGARAGTRKSVAAVQAFITSGLGVLAGKAIAVPLVMAIGYLAIGSLDWVNWWVLAALLIGVPLLAAGLTWLLVPGHSRPVKTSTALSAHGGW